MTIQDDIKKAMKAGSIIIGSNNVIRGLKTGEIKSVIYPSNCKEEMLKDLSYYSEHFGIETQKFEGNSRQLGEICAKPFNIMLIGIKK